jgi:hypothetical protein
MSTSITSNAVEVKEVTPEQQKQAIRTITDAFAKGLEYAFQTLAKKGELNRESFQLALSQGGILTQYMIRETVQKFTWLARNSGSHLKLISSGTDIIIGPSEGKRKLIEMGELFSSICYRGNLASLYYTENSKVVVCKPRPKTRLQVLELVRGGSSRQIFSGFGLEFDQLCLTEDQIILFCENHRKWLHDGVIGTLALFKLGDDYFVTQIGGGSDGVKLDLGIRTLDDSITWDPDFDCRVVVPILS